MRIGHYALSDAHLFAIYRRWDIHGTQICFGKNKMAVAVGIVPFDGSRDAYNASDDTAAAKHERIR